VPGDERLIEAKAHGKKLTVMPRRKPEAEPDLMKALQISLQTGSKQKLFKVATASQKTSLGTQSRIGRITSTTTPAVPDFALVLA
jgi:hypothetical protein